jgi:tetratricopeptide (TPR) repeat protein
MTKKKPSAMGTKSNGATHSEPVHKTVSVEPPSPYEVQLKTYEQGIRLFSQNKLNEACACFREAARGPAPHIADKARSYAHVCEQRTAAAETPISTAEEHFNYGVERLNARDVERARQHFDRALTLQPDADHVLYTMALCCGLAGDGAGAYENLKRAIDLEPRNRILARQDPEFLALFSQVPALRALLAPEHSEGF